MIEQTLVSEQKQKHIAGVGLGKAVVENAGVWCWEDKGMAGRRALRAAPGLWDKHTTAHLRESVSL